jgi:pyruvate/2-oxoglutarate dehydrogenase complex dihydrolipoamide acyltransferase (E2) component
MKVAALALRRHPLINAGVHEGEIHVWEGVNIGLAMEVNDNLLVPVIRSPDIKGLLEINSIIADLGARAKQNNLEPDELAGGTFTITNLGFAGVDHFTPILRPPESAILGVGRITKKPVVRNDNIVSEARIGFSLTFDHRIIDGAPAARFLRTIVDMVEEPLLLLA